MASEPELQMGQSGEWVSYLEQMLQHAGYWNGAVDGEFGPELEGAVKQYQEACGLSADGVAREDTWAALSGVPASGTGTGTGTGEASGDPGERVLDVNWAEKFPELYKLATAADFDDYVRTVVEVDPALLQSEDVS